MGCNMQPGSKFNQSLYMQPEMVNCPPDKQNMGLWSDTEIEGLLADAGYNVKASDLALVAQRLEQLETLCASQDTGVLSHLSAEAVHYNPSDMASWVECMIEELAPSSLVGGQDVGTVQSLQENALLPQTPLCYSLEDVYGPFSCSMEEEPCMDQYSSSQKMDVCTPFSDYSTKQSAPSMLLQPSVESAPSISQLIKDAIGHTGVPSAASNGPKGYSGVGMLSDEMRDLQQYKIVEDQVSSNQMGSLYPNGTGDLSQQSPFSNAGFSTGLNPLPKSSSMPSLHQQHVATIAQPQTRGNVSQRRMRQPYASPAPASSQSSNNRVPFQETPAAHFPQPHQPRQNQVDMVALEAKVRANASPSNSSPISMSYQEQSSPHDLSSDKLSHSQTPQAGAYFDANDEGAQESGIKLVHLLMACAEAIQNGELAAAVDMVREIKRLASSTSGAMSKVANHFVEALARRIYPGGNEDSAYLSRVDVSELLYANFYEACPYLKFSHFTANQAILEAFQGHKFVHVIDFNLMQGLQWPALIHALALRPGGPPHLRMTGIGPPHPDSKDVLQEIGMKLAQTAGNVNVEFSFRGMVATKLDDVKPWYFEVKQGEAIAVNSIFQLHRLLNGHVGSDRSKAPIDEVLASIKSLNPKVVTVVEQEANHNSNVFLERFVEALHYYSTMFDSLEACSLHPQCSEMACTEVYLSREIANIVACEGVERVERHEPLSQWRKRMENAGFRPLHLGSNAFKQASMLLKYFSGEGYTVEENNGCITLGWHSRPLIAASAWQCG
ncbi:hypothetical protein L7F22_022563 [Adiantum nelumboides]|nr:hypothetical protein [Adiantum nelumboides]